MIRSRKRRRNNAKPKRLFRRRKPFIARAIPDKTVIQLTYVTDILLTPATVGATATYVFRANSLHDPDFTGVGHQPLGFDQWAAFYKNYVVTSSSIKAHFQNDNSITGGSVGIHLAADNSPETADELRENPRCKWDSIGSIQADSIAKVSNGFNGNKYFDTDVVLGSSVYGADVVSNPARVAFFVVWYHQVLGVAANTCHAAVSITFTAQLSEMQDLQAS